jgi:hypothetical protein
MVEDAKNRQRQTWICNYVVCERDNKFAMEMAICFWTFAKGLL